MNFSRVNISVPRTANYSRACPRADLHLEKVVLPFAFIILLIILGLIKLCIVKKFGRRATAHV